MKRELVWRAFAFSFVVIAWVVPFMVEHSSRDIRMGAALISGLLCWGAADVLRAVRERAA